MSLYPRIAAAAVCLPAIAWAGDSLGFERYTGYNDPAVSPGSAFHVTIDANQSQGWVDFTFAMDLAQGVGTITTIWFEEGAEGLDDDGWIVDSHGTLDMRMGRGSGNPAGANGELGWEGTLDKLGKRGSAANGIDAGEWLTVRFEADAEFFAEGLARFLTGQTRIAFHLQRIGSNRNESAHFVSTGSTFLNVVPLPTPGLLAGVGLAGAAAVARPRRR